MRRIILAVLLLIGSAVTVESAQASDFGELLGKHRQELVTFSNPWPRAEFSRSQIEKIAELESPEGTFKVVTAFWIWTTAERPESVRIGTSIRTTLITPDGNAFYSGGIALFNKENGREPNKRESGANIRDLFTANGKTYIVVGSTIGIYDAVIDAFRYADIEVVGPPVARPGNLYLENQGEYAVLYKRRFQGERGQADPAHGFGGVQWFDQTKDQWYRSYADLGEHQLAKILDVSTSPSGNIVAHVVINRTRSLEVIFHVDTKLFTTSIVRHEAPPKVAAR